jgi:hypothetical protein
MPPGENPFTVKINNNNNNNRVTVGNGVFYVVCAKEL